MQPFAWVRSYFYDCMSPGQQANDTHHTVWWHPNPLRYLTRGITDLLAIIQFASCKLPFHSVKKWSPICNICVKRITKLILIFPQTIRRHIREHGVHKITHGLGGRGGGGRWRDCQRAELAGSDAAGGAALAHKKMMKVARTSHTAGLNQSVRDSKDVHHLCSARSLSSPKKKNNFEYISRHNFSANQK